MPISKTRRVVVLQKRKKAGGGAPAAGGGEVMIQTETTVQEDQAIPVVSLFGWQVPLCSQFTWNLVQRIKA